MGNIYLGVILFLAKTFIVSILLLLPIFFINKKLQIKFLDKIITVIISIAITAIVIFMIVFFTYLLIVSFIVFYNVIYLGCFKFLGAGISNYLALTSILILSAYFPDKMGSGFLMILEKVSRKNAYIYQYYKIFVKFLRIKVWVYLFAFVVTFINSLEISGNKTLITHNIWLQMKPFIYQSVVTFIAFDRFSKSFTDEKKNIIDDIKKIISLVKNQKDNEINIEEISK